jgi:hypothetical protein
MIQGRPLSSYFTQHNSHGADASHDYDSSCDFDSSSGTDASPNQTRNGVALQAMEARTKMRRLIVTKSGMLGLAPAMAQVGDAIIIIAGYGKPVIATAEVVGGKRAWRLRGEAYVHGMMESEKMPINSVKPELMLGSEDLGLDRLVFL